MESTPTWVGFEHEAAKKRYWSQLRARERSDPGFSSHATYVKHRRLYVDGVWQLCEDHRLAETTAHLATRYFDFALQKNEDSLFCLLYASPSPRDQRGSRMPSSA